MSSVDAPTQRIAEPATRVAGPLSRFWARSYDLMVWSQLFWALLFAVLGGEGVASTFPEHRFTSVMFWLWLTTPVALFIDACVYGLFENTPCKAIIGIRVVTSSGAAPTFSQYLRRNLAMWAPGLAFGIPPAQFLTCAFLYVRVNKGTQAPWDERGGFEVRQHGKTWIRILVLFVGAILLKVFASVSLAEPYQRMLQGPGGLGAVRANADFPEAPSLSQWTNPMNGFRQSLPDGWVGGKVDDDKRQLWEWKRSDGAWAAMYYIPLNGKAPHELDHFADWMRSYGTGNWSLVGQGTLQAEGRPVWQAEGLVPADTGTFAGRFVYVMTRIFPGDDGIWFMQYLSPVSEHNYPEALTVGRLLTANTIQR